MLPTIRCTDIINTFKSFASDNVGQRSQYSTRCRLPSNRESIVYAIVARLPVETPTGFDETRPTLLVGGSTEPPRHQFARIGHCLCCKICDTTSTSLPVSTRAVDCTTTKAAVSSEMGSVQSWSSVRARRERGKRGEKLL